MKKANKPKIIIGLTSFLRLDMSSMMKSFVNFLVLAEPPNGLRYLRWGGDGEAVQPEK
jgi:hypothetical protein